MKNKNNKTLIILFLLNILVVVFTKPFFVHASVAGPPYAYVSDGGYGAIYRDGGNPDIDEADENLNIAIKSFIDEYKTVLVVLMGFAILTSLLAFIVNFLRLGMVAERPVLRRKIVANLLTNGILLALLGGFTLILTIFYSIIFN